MPQWKYPPYDFWGNCNVTLPSYIVCLWPCMFSAMANKLRYRPWNNSVTTCLFTISICMFTIILSSVIIDTMEIAVDDRLCENDNPKRGCEVIFPILQSFEDVCLVVVDWLAGWRAGWLVGWLAEW